MHKNSSRAALPKQSGQTAGLFYENEFFWIECAAFLIKHRALLIVFFVVVFLAGLFDSQVPGRTDNAIKNQICGFLD